MTDVSGVTPAVQELFLVLEQQLQVISTTRFTSVSQLQQHALNNYKVYKTEFQSWLQRLNAEVCKLRETGNTTEAKWLREQLQNHRDYRPKDRFKVTIIPETGRRETWQVLGEADPSSSETTSQHLDHDMNAESGSVKGTPDQMEHENGRPMRRNLSANGMIASRMNPEVNASASNQPSAYEVAERAAANFLSDLGSGDPSQQLCPEAQSFSVSLGATTANIQQLITALEQIQSSFEQVSVDVEKFGGAMTLSQVIDQKLWIGQTHSGKAFCLTCPCPAMLAPTDVESRGTSKGTHHLVPSSFHFHPFVNNDGLRHFLKEHGEVFTDIGEMLRKYGKEIQSDDIKLDTWAILGHNMSIQLWHERCAAERTTAESQLLEQCKHGKPLLVPSKSRSIDRSKVPEQYSVYSRTSNGGGWIVHCPFPACSKPHFEKDPFQDDTAIRHFKKHNLRLTNTQIHHHFGLKVIPDSTSRDAGKREREESSDSDLQCGSIATVDSDQSFKGEAIPAAKRPARISARQWVPGAVKGGQDIIQYKVHSQEHPEGKFIGFGRLQKELKEMARSYDLANNEVTPEMKWPWCGRQERQ